MKSIFGGIILMVIVAVVAAFGLEVAFDQDASETHVSQNGSVRLGE